MTRARSFLTYAASFVAIALVLGVCMGAWALTRQGTPAASPSASAAASGAASPSAASSLAPDDLRVLALGPLPAEHRFVFAGENGKERLMLVDADHGVVMEAAHFEGLGSFTEGRGGDITGTADGKTVIVMLEGKSDARVYVIHPESAAVTSFKIAAADTPRLSPDGKQLAYSRTLNDGARDGVWLMDTASGSEKRIIVAIGGKPPKPATWSADGRYLALTGMESGSSIGLFDTQASSTKTVAQGAGARWRGGELYYWSGPTLSAYDPAAAKTRVVYQTGGNAIVRIELKPSANDVASIEQQGSDATVWLRNAGADRALRGGGNVIAMWWSADGKKLYVWDSVEATTMVSDAFTGTTAVKFCLRGNIAPPCS